MIVSELISKLQTLPQDALVLTRGYESGMNAATDVNYTMVKDLSPQPWYEGRYESFYTDMSDERYTDAVRAEYSISAVYIGG
jgi:hypothetical protein